MKCLWCKGRAKAVPYEYVPRKPSGRLDHKRTELWWRVVCAGCRAEGPHRRDKAEATREWRRARSREDAP